MQKLLAGKPIATATLPSLNSFLSSYLSHDSLSLAISKNPKQALNPMATVPSPAASTLRYFHHLSRLNPAVVSSAGVGLCSSGNLSLECTGPRPRSWVALRQENSRGTHRAWVGTVAEGSEGAESGVETGEQSGSGVEERPAARLQRRQRGGGDAPERELAGAPDLLTIPGVGPRNFQKLVKNGFEGVSQLKQLYRDKFYGKQSEKMVEFLQSSVGIVHKNHAESITTFIKQSVDEDETKEDSISALKVTQKKRITFCVEGNISVGKTTFLQRLANETLELQDLVEIVPEPVDKWQNVGPDHFNILDAFYAEPERYAYTFQNYVFVTRLMQERESSSGIKPLRLMERSVFSDRMVFVRAVHEAKWMNEMEISIYDSWFDPVLSSLPGLIPDGFIYLRASPDTCHKRMMLRKRSEEGGVSLEYLQGLHEKHENWLFPFESGNHGVLSVIKPTQSIDNSLSPDISDRVFYLEGNHMHPSIQKVPALILDCEPNIDYSKDIEAKKQYARQVAEFFQFVKKKKEVTDATTPGCGEAPTMPNQPQVILPHKGDLWIPGGKFPGTPLKSLDFKQTVAPSLSLR
ncbi:unnamed protein product [Cuscuta campestris]|uniref:Deoxynucleoside kinase domain-containing protein n=1 Tax=Cuscuta campestris TaxID=132261 RepID=A0A484MNY3_9ASTE|nr:unnamed protein product [Cuscuta campestris]